MFQNSNWPNGYYCNTSSSNNHESYFQVTTNEVSYEIFPPNNNPNSNVPQTNTFDRSYTYSYPTYPPPPYKPRPTTISPIVHSNDNGYTPITPTESITLTDKAHSESKKRRKRRTEEKVLSIKQSICKKHARHATLEEQKRCEENRIRNREASRRSRQKKISTIEKQREEIEQLKFVISHKDKQINEILKHHKLLSDRLQFLESQLMPMNKQQTYEIKQNVRENHIMGPPSQQHQNMAINARAMEAIEAEKYIDRILDDMNKMGVVDIDIQKSLEISTPILKQAIQHVLKPSEPILEEPKKFNEEIAESEMEHPAENEEEESNEDEYEPRPDCLCLGDDEEDDQDELMTTPGTVTVSVKETVINSPIFRMKIHSVQSTSPIQYRTLTTK